MGEDDFSTQMQQEPQATQSGFFEVENLKSIASYELGNTNLYILVDTAESLSANADDRAICIIGVDSYKDLPRYTIFDSFSGIWDEDLLCEKIIEAFLKYSSAKCFIEGTGGGLILERLLQKKILETNAALKLKNQPFITNTLQTYPTIKKISKMQKISAIKPYLNTGYLRFLNNASGISKIKAQLNSFNPTKPHRKNDCIDTIATCIYLSDCFAPKPQKQKPYNPPFRNSNKPTWRI